MLVGQVFSQAETNLGHLRNVYQASYVDPANYTDHRLSIGIPILSSNYVAFANTGFAVKHLLTKEKIDGYHRLDEKALLRSLRNKNYIYTGLEVDLFHVETKIKNFHWSVYSRERVDVRFGYPEDLFELPLRGNGAFKGDVIDFSGLAVDATHFNELGIGMTMSGIKTVYGNVIVGGKIKLLQGRSNIRTSTSDATISISEDIYEHDVNGELKIKTAGLPYSFQDGTTDFDPMSYFFNFKNLGVGIDIGGAIQLHEDLKLWGSMIDFGFIRWKTNPQALVANGDLFIGGFDIATELLGDSSNLSVDLLKDSLKNAFTLDTLTNERYTTMTTTKFNVGVDYKIIKNLEATATVNIFPYRGLRSTLALGLYYEPWRFLNISIVNTMQYKMLINPGFGLVIKPGPVQIYMVSDNILGAAFNPYASKSANFRIGINLVFGKDEPQIPPVLCPDHHTRHHKHKIKSNRPHRGSIRKLMKVKK